MMYPIILEFTIQSVMEVIWDPGLKARVKPVLTYQGFGQSCERFLSWSLIEARMTTGSHSGIAASPPRLR